MPEDLLQELLDDPDRDTFYGAAPVVSYDPHQDEPEFLAGVNDRSQRRARLIRRGSDHGHYAVIHEEAARYDAKFALKRWRSARPIVLRGHFDDYTELAGEGDALYDRLRNPEELLPWARGAALPDGVSVSDLDQPLDDPERDLRKLCFDDPGAAEGLAWMKLTRLSNHPEDDSLRLRVGFGRERHDDASPLLERQRLISRLGQALLPGMRELCDDDGLAAELKRLLRGEALLSQPIAYWNRPGGGALFHHDAFGENSPNGQRGVLYAQLSGETLWLALSINDLAARVREIIEAMTLGELPELREHLYPEDGMQPLLPILADDELLRRELGSPGCGRFASLVNNGPAFTAWLADSGHACVLGPGDGILLPNHGVHHTCMHSVFCVSDHTTYALSMAIRLDEHSAPAGG